ncbi:MAG: MerR family transcriptional regulator [Oligoflexia bacterium]|nr:MerR family transcriptional regulator [Oligoflexia bacterium]
MVDVEALAQNILFEENFLPESYIIAEDVEGELRSHENETEDDDSDEKIVAILENFPDKTYRIGEVAELVGVKVHVIRYWESEFGSHIRPQKTQGGQRLYTTRDVEFLIDIKRLLYRERYSLSGAKKKIRELSATEELPLVSKEVLVVLKEELEELSGDISRALETLDGFCRRF